MQSYIVAAGFLVGLGRRPVVQHPRLCQPNIGMNYLLACVRRGVSRRGAGRAGPVQRLGCGDCCLCLAAGISGLQQLGAAFYVEQFFNGGALLAAVALAKWMASRSLAAMKK